MRKLLVSDYDQTFYLNDIDIEKNKIAVALFRKQKNIFIIATGRSYLDFLNVVNLYNIQYDYIIINHGATILDSKGNILANFEIDNEIINNLKEDLQLEKAKDMFCCSKLESRVDFKHKDLTKIGVLYATKEQALIINDIINTKYKNYVNSYYVNENSIEIISNEINKSKAIKLLLNELMITSEYTYTIGDGYSDIEMIKDFNGYAMINSVDEIKKVAIKEVESVSDLVSEII